MTFVYSDDAVIDEAIEYIKKTDCTYEHMQEKFALTDDDVNLIDFIINEF